MGFSHHYNDDMTGPWLYWGSGMAIALGGLALLAWALIGDRSRGRQRCPKCWYAMNEAPSLRCPECGFETQHEKGLYKTRRRGKWAVASILPFALATYLAAQPKVEQDGWASVMPVTVFLLLFQFDDADWIIEGIEYHATRELKRPNIPGTYRGHEKKELWQWQWRWLGRTAIRRLDDADARVSRQQLHVWMAVSLNFSEDEQLRHDFIQAFIQEIDHDDHRVRASAANMLIDRTDIEGSLARIVPHLDHEDQYTRLSVFTPLRMLVRSNQKAIEQLLSALDHNDPEVRAHAVGALRWAVEWHRDARDVYEAVDAMQDDPSGKVRYWRVRTLAHMQDQSDAWQTIEQAMRSDDLFTRRGGFSAATMQGNRPASITPQIVSGVVSNDDRIRNDAILLLHQHNPDDLVRYDYVLSEYLLHDDKQVVAPARLAIARLRSR